MSQPNMQSDRAAIPNTPRWVKVFGIITLVLGLLFGILHLTGNSLGNHGGYTLPIERDVQQP